MAVIHPLIGAMLLLPAMQAPQDGTAEQGRRIVQASCETCHSLRPGEVRVGPSLYGALNGSTPRLTSVAARQTLLHGRNKMPAYGGVFNERETDAILRYLESLP